jgi:hypothetical protein
MSIGTGTFSLRDIILEIYGADQTSLQKSLVDCFNDADPAVSGGTLPVSMRDFSGHTQKWGRVYGQEDISFDVWSYTPTQGYDAFGGTETLLYTADRNDSVYLYKSGTGTAITSGDAIRVELYTRTKQSSDSWSFSVGWNNYDTATDGPHSLTSTISDYKFIITNNI